MTTHQAAPSEITMILKNENRKQIQYDVIKKLMLVLLAEEMYIVWGLQIHLSCFAHNRG